MANAFQFALYVVIVTVVGASNINIQGIVNSTVTMPCDLSGTNGSLVYWYSRSLDNYLSSERDVNRLLSPELSSRLTVRGDNTRYDLEISPVRFTDGGIYGCHIYTIINQTSQKFLKTIDYELVVHSAPLPQYPDCVVRGSGMVNVRISLTCLSRGGVPPAQLKWYRGDELLPSIKDLATNTLTYNKTLSEEDNGVNFTCKASSPVFMKPRECTVTLLNVPPTVSLTQSRGRVVEKDEVTYWCSGMGMPSVSYQWLMNGATVTEDSDRILFYDDRRELHLQSAEITDNGTMVTCQVSTPSGLIASQGMMLLVSRKEDACNGSSIFIHMPSKIPVIAVLVAFVGGIGITLLFMIVIRALCKRHRRRRDLRAKRAEELWSSKHSDYSTTAEPTSGQDIFTKDSAFVTSSNGLQPPPNPQSVQNIQAQKNQYFEMHSGGFRESSATFPKSGPRSDYQIRSTAPSPPILPLDHQAFGYENVARGSGTDLTDMSPSETSAPSGFDRPSVIYMEPKVPSRPIPQLQNGNSRSQSLQRVTYDAVPKGTRRNADFTKDNVKEKAEQPEYTEIDCMTYTPIRNTYEASVISNFEL